MSAIKLAPSSVLYFGKSETRTTSYILQRAAGQVPPELCGTYLIGEDKGRKYVLLETPQVNEKVKKRFSLLLATRNESLKNQRESVSRSIVTGITIDPEFPDFGYGDFGNDAYLFIFGKEKRGMRILVFKDMKMYVKNLFERLTKGDLPMSINSEAVLILDDKLSKSTGSQGNNFYYGRHDNAENLSLV